jgi:hypothetical protein
MPERRKCIIREALQIYSLLDNGSQGTFPQQQIGLWKAKRCYEINTRFHGHGIGEELLEVVICIHFTPKL